MPDLADPWRLAELHKTYSGRLKPAVFVRLNEAVEGVSEDIDYGLRFAKEAGRAVLEGHVRARLVMKCQRCLEPVEVAVDSVFRFGVVASEADSERLPDDLDPLLVTDQPVDPLDLLEDELLLCLPLVPMHQPGECRRPSVPGPDETERSPEIKTKKDNPFAALSVLKGR